MTFQNAEEKYNKIKERILPLLSERKSMVKLANFSEGEIYMFYDGDLYYSGLPAEMDSPQDIFEGFKHFDKKITRDEAYTKAAQALTQVFYRMHRG